MTPRPPEALPLIVDNVPDHLPTVAHWVDWCWEKRASKWTKIPINAASGARASSTDPSTWSTFEEAIWYARKNLLPGVGFVFANCNPFAGVDLDGCRDPQTGRLEAWAREIVAELDSYAEVSPSGRGIKVFVRGTLPPGRKRKGPVEMYDSGRFFTVTGHRLSEAPADVTERPEELAALHCRVFGVAPSVAPEGQSQTRPTTPLGGMVLDDTELVRRARAAANGEKFARLWSGDTSEYADGGNEGRSEADLALCSLLAFWAGADASRIDVLFRQSGLMRPKWDERHYGDGRTYGQGTIQHALAGGMEFWSGRSSIAGVVGGTVYARRKGAISLG